MQGSPFVSPFFHRQLFGITQKLANMVQNLHMTIWRRKERKKEKEKVQ
jgi:hypothetical protein